MFAFNDVCPSNMHNSIVTAKIITIEKNHLCTPSDQGTQSGRGITKMPKRSPPPSLSSHDKIKNISGYESDIIKQNFNEFNENGSSIFGLIHMRNFSK